MQAIGRKCPGLRAGAASGYDAAEHMLVWAPADRWRMMRKSLAAQGVSMDNLQLKQVPITKTGMLVRKPVADVFEAFVNPDITTKFWFHQEQRKAFQGSLWCSRASKRSSSITSD
jgi:hypothetical protein